MEYKEWSRRLVDHYFNFTLLLLSVIFSTPTTSNRR